MSTHAHQNVEKPEFEIQKKIEDGIKDSYKAMLIFMGKSVLLTYGKLAVKKQK